MKQNWFETLSEALEAEGLEGTFPIGGYVSYDQTYSYTFDDGSKYGKFVSVYRNERGLYERPISYRR
jgi:hypothetical protein